MYLSICLSIHQCSVLRCSIVVRLSQHLLPLRTHTLSYKVAMRDFYTLCVFSVGKPWFTKEWYHKLQYFVLPASADFNLRCGAGGIQPLKYTWLKNGSPLSTSRWVHQIKTAVLSDSGLYTCIVSNKFGNISRSFRLSIVGKRFFHYPIFIGRQKDKHIMSISTLLASSAF